MTVTKPFGNLSTASIMVIGHDPRLQRGKAEAKYAFFLDYLEIYNVTPSYGPEKRKYELARAVVDYVSKLAGHQVPLDNLYVTNLCNEFLPSTQGYGTVLIPDAEAKKGYKDICQAIYQGHFKVVVPTSCQVFYHLCRLGFLDEKVERITLFVEKASPRKGKQELGAYATTGKAPFLEVCGERFHHNGIPVVPVLHVKQWPIKTKAIRYTDPMEHAKREIREILK
jgi:hypothetical protein